MTQKEQEIIMIHLRAFNQHFKEARIFKQGKWYYVYQSEPDDNHNWKWASDNIHEINGWLYGAVQAVCTLVRKS